MNAKLQKDINFYNYNYFNNNKNKKETKKNNSMKKNKKISKELEEINFYSGINSRSLFSDEKKENKIFPNINTDKIYLNNDEHIVKYTIKDDESEKKFKKKEEKNTLFESLLINKINDDNNYFSPPLKNINNSSNSINDFFINNFTPKKLSYSSSVILENSCEFSFPFDYDDKIQIKEDISYCIKNSKYIKYHPIDEYIWPISIKDKKQFNNKIGKSKKINFIKNYNDYINLDSDNDITDFASNNYTNNNMENHELDSILCIPRIKPFKEEHSKIIVNQLEHEGITIHKDLNEKMLKEEQNLYIGSFLLYDEKNNIKVNVPCYKENEKMKDFIIKKNIKLIEFQEDNDIDTDEEQLGLEIERSNEALLNFMKKVENEKDYVEKNLIRRKKV